MSAQTIELRLIVDGKEATYVIDDVKRNVEALKKALGGVPASSAGSINALEEQLQDAATAMRAAAVGSDEFKAKLAEVHELQDRLRNATARTTEKIVPMAGSIAALEQEIRDANEALRYAVIGTDQYKQKLSELQILQQRLHTVSRTATESTNVGMNRMTMAIGGLGYAVGDANMFLYDFRIGMMAIGNNIPILIEHFVAAGKEAKGMGVSVKDVLVQSLKGPGGLMLAINGVVLLMQILPGLFGEQTDAIKDQAKEVEKLKDEYQKLTREQLKGKLLEASRELKALEKQQSEAGTGTSSYAPAGIQPGSYAVNATANQNAKAAFDDQIKLAKEKVKVIEEELSLLGDITDTERTLTQLEEKRKKIQDSNWKQLVPEATDKANAFDIVDAQIAAEQKKLGKGGKGSGRALLTEFEAEQEHQIKLMELYGFSASSILEKQIEHLNSRKTIYQKFGESISDIERQINEKLIELEKAKSEESLAIKKKELQQIADQMKLEEEIDKAFTDTDSNSEIIKYEELAKLKISLGQDEFEQKRLLNDLELQMNEEKYSAIAGGETMLTMLREEHQKTRAEIDREEAQMKLSIISNMLGAAAGMFGEQTAAYKLLAIAQATIDTYKAANAALDLPIPFNYIAMGTVIATGLANVARIQETKIPGYAKGGVVVGEQGPEIIAPMQDYATGWAQVINATVRATERMLMTGGGGTGGGAKVQRHEFRIKNKDLVTGLSRGNEAMDRKKW